MAIVIVHREAESGSRHIKVIGPMQHDADVKFESSKVAAVRRRFPSKYLWRELPWHVPRTLFDLFLVKINA